MHYFILLESASYLVSKTIPLLQLHKNSHVLQRWLPIQLKAATHFLVIDTTTQTIQEITQRISQTLWSNKTTQKTQLHNSPHQQWTVTTQQRPWTRAPMPRLTWQTWQTVFTKMRSRQYELTITHKYKVLTWILRQVQDRRRLVTEPRCSMQTKVQSVLPSTRKEQLAKSVRRLVVL